MLDNLVLKKYIYGLFGFNVGEHPYNELHSKPTPASLAVAAAAAAALEGNATTTTDRAPIGANEPRVEELPNENLTSSTASTTTTTAAAGAAAGVKKESTNDKKKSSSASDLD